MNRTILLVDEEPDVLLPLARFFELRGWAVQRAVESAAALKLYENERPDLILVNVGAAGTGGLDCLGLLRSRDVHAAVIMLAPTARIDAAIQAVRSGADGFLTLPVQLPHLDAVAESAMENVEQRRLHRDAAAGGQDLTLAAAERRHIARVLALHEGNRSRAARSLGISRATLYEKLARYSLDRVGRRAVETEARAAGKSSPAPGSANG